jgi:HTH-type transcriptional regulator/antitoxin HipB
MSKYTPQYGRTQTTEELGTLARAHRKTRRLTLDTLSGLSNLSPKFLSEFERGKPTAEIGKVLKALKILGLEVIVRPASSTVKRNQDT